MGTDDEALRQLVSQGVLRVVDDPNSPEEAERQKALDGYKRHALECLNDGDVRSAICSMLKDVREDKRIGCAEAVAAFGLLIATQEDIVEARRWIEGFR